MFFVNVGFVIECIFFEYRHLLEQYLNWLCEVNILSWCSVVFTVFPITLSWTSYYIYTCSVANSERLIFWNNYQNVAILFFDLFNDYSIIK